MMPKWECPSSPVALVVPFMLTIAALFVTGADDVLQTIFRYKFLIIKLSSSLLIGYISNYFLAKRQRAKWEAQEFLKAVQISLNYVDDVADKGKTLQFRTLDECGVDELMNHNQEGITKIIAACDSCTVDQSFLGVFNENETRTVEYKHLDMFMKAVINRISVKFADGYLDYDFRVPVLKKDYWLGLTCERPKPGQTFARKIRVMVCSDGFMRSIPRFENPPKFEIPHHKARWECMQQMHALYKQDQEILSKGGHEFWKKQILRKITIFRALHYPYEQAENNGGSMVRKGDVRVRNNESPGPSLSSPDLPTWSRGDDGEEQDVFRSRKASRENDNSARRMLKAKSSLGMGD